VVHLGPLKPLDTLPEPWTMDHSLHVLMQIESRPLPPNDKGERWTERRLTGKATAVCSCGYSSGLIDTSELPRVEQLAIEHPLSMKAQVSGLLA